MTSPPADEPRVLPRAEHTISRRHIDDNALKVLYRLHRGGHKAFLCGGGVRDLLLERRPKDFDIATSARPPQVRRLFRNSRIIGRRFRLAHVYFKGQIIEVATFRRDPDPEAQDGGDDELLITDDNVFGTPREDAFRRDFTVNGLFYNIADYSVIDYVGGIDDLEARVIRVIGDPELRFREDPVRLSRACELAARLEFTIEPAAQEAAVACARELEKAAPARLTEELLDIFRSGKAADAVQWMLELELLPVVVPELLATVDSRERGLGDYTRLLEVLDAKAEAGEKLTDIQIFAAILLPLVLIERDKLGRRAPASPGALREHALAAIRPFFQRLTLSKHRAEQVAQAIAGHERLRRAEWKGPERPAFAHKPFFEDALLLFEISVAASGEGRDELERWRHIAKRVRRSPERPPTRRPRRRPRRRRRRRRQAR